MIQVTHTIRLDESEIRMDFVHASGPGGQNVNKVATAVQLRFNARSSRSLPADVRERLLRLRGARVTAEGELLIEARRHRSQARNRDDAIERLIALVRQAAVKPKPRRRTRPSAASAKRRFESKLRRARVKSMRRPLSRNEE